MAATTDTVLCAWEASKCYESRVSGSRYCEDHMIEAHNARRSNAPVDLGGMIRKAKQMGYIASLPSGYQHERRAAS